MLSHTSQINNPRRNKKYGGAFVISSASATISTSLFESNQAGLYGHDLYLEDGGTVDSSATCPSPDIAGGPGCSAAACYDSDTSSICFPAVHSCDCRYPSAMPTLVPTPLSNPPTVTHQPTPRPTSSPTPAPTPLPSTPPSPSPSTPPTPAPTPAPTPPPTVTAKMSIAPNALLLSVTKPSVVASSAFVANVNTWPLNGSATVRNTTLPNTANVSISPATLVIPPGELVEIFISLPSSGLTPRAYTIDIGIDADPPNSVVALSAHLILPVELRILANADARTSRVAISGTPIVNAPWHGIQLTPFDADGFRIQTDQKKAFDVSLSSGDLTESCDVLWREESTSYEGACTVPDVGRAGDWSLTITLGDQLVFSSTVRVRCQEDYYMLDDGACIDCPGAAVCLAGSTLESLHLKPGFFRMSETTSLVRACPLPAGCVGGNVTGRYCREGHDGPLCARCRPEFYMLRDRCTPCASASHWQVVFVVAAIASIMASLRYAARSVRFRAVLEFIIRTLAVQLRILWSTTQILAQYSTLLAGMMPSEVIAFFEYLDVVNFDLISLPSAACADSITTTFFFKLVMQTAAPVFVTLLLVAVYAVRTRLFGFDHAVCRHTCTKWFLIMCFVILPSVSTTICSTFQCDAGFGDDAEYSFLVADYRVSCRSASYRRVMVPFALLCFAIYPVGVHVLYCCTLWKYRDKIQLHNGNGAEHISFLFSAYSGSAWFWEPVDSLRRLSCTGLLVFFGNGRHFAAVAIAYAFQVLYMAQAPYADPENNRLASTANLVIVAILLVLVFGAYGIIGSSIITITCTATPASMLLLVVGDQVRNLWQRRAMLVTLHELRVNTAPDESDGTITQRPAGRVALLRTQTISRVMASGDASRHALTREVFSSLEGMLEPPISSEDWRESIALLNNLPMEESDFGDLTLGLTYFIGDAQYFGRLDEPTSKRSRSLTQVSKRGLPSTSITLDESKRTLTFDESGPDHSAGLVVSYEVPRYIALLLLLSASSTCFYPILPTSQANLFIALKALVWAKDCELISQMHTMRDRMKTETSGGRQICGLKSFGSVEQQMSRSSLALLGDFPEELVTQIKPQLDREVFARLLRLTATASLGAFEGQLRQHFPGAPFVPNPSLVLPSDRFAIMLGPIKGVERMLVKWDEYCEELGGAGNQFPIASQIKDLLRCTVLVRDGDALWDAWERIRDGFDVRAMNGRLKNNMATIKHQPPNMLINVLVRAPGSPVLVGEVQIFLVGVKTLAESAGHRYYEIRRAPTWDLLYAEATKSVQEAPSSVEQSGDPARLLQTSAGDNTGCNRRATQPQTEITRGGDVEIEMAGTSMGSSVQPMMEKSKSASWSFVPLCAAEHESDDGPMVGETQHDVGLLLARLAEKDALVAQKEALVAEKDAEIRRLLLPKQQTWGWMSR